MARPRKAVIAETIQRVNAEWIYRIHFCGRVTSKPELMKPAPGLNAKNASSHGSAEVLSQADIQTEGSALQKQTHRPGSAEFTRPTGKTNSPSVTFSLNGSHLSLAKLHVTHSMDESKF